ncbi:ankyrin [Cucurbitaria berberidis CBS 394.84]|uniref:Ankyrin n=1 Tax=Cucurbitaria berberidis CBS 394.84 TaxID=1168544 RepID=A0A9P4LDG7_9PLEO|nr:ankyrin [Cucurbitaria berberidis CBS 394.84]KAF1850372.1 ankyrin [Cucurbitaria berberidis CBS 394.84]
MPKRRAEDDEWDLHRDDIVQLYINEDRPQAEVMNEPAARGFRRTKAQWERKLKKWGLAKNATKDEWKFIVGRLREREAQNKLSSVIVRGITLPESRIKKQRRIHDHHTTFERIARDLKPLNRLPTPPGVSISTPKPPQSPGFETLPQDRITIRQPGSLLVGSASFVQIRDSPWLQFLSSIKSSLTAHTSEHSNSPCQLANYGASERLDVYIPKEVTESPGAQFAHGGIVLAQYLDFETRLHPIFFDQRPYIPRDQSGVINVEFNDSYDLIEVNSYLDTLKLIVGAIANNFGTESMARLVSELARSRSATSILQRLLRQELVVVKACAEKLLIPAVQQRDLYLVRILVDSGVDINVRACTRKSFHPVTALQCAVEVKDERILELLLARDNADWAAHLYHYRYECYADIKAINNTKGTIVDVAVIMGEGNILKRLLAIARDEPKVSLRTLHRAVLQGRLDFIDMLIEIRPELLVEAMEVPWILLEAAATCEGTAVFEALVSQGLDAEDVDELGRGSALASASAHGNERLVHHLIAAGAELSGTAFGSGAPIHADNSQYFSKWKLRDLYGMAALHAAVYNDKKDLVSLLLSHGADPNQSCRVYPIQLAAWNGNEAIVKLLIKSHADVKATPHEVEDGYYFRDGSLNFACGDATRTAIRLAFEKGHLGVVDVLYKAGGSLPPCDPDNPFYAYESPFDIIRWQKTRIVRDTYNTNQEWDPLAIAIEKQNSKFLTGVIRRGYIRSPMTTIHLCRCILIHGIDFTQKLMQQDLLTLDIAVCPMVLYAATCKGEEVFASRLVTKLMTTLGHKEFIQHHGPTALKLAVMASQLALGRMFLKAGINPYESEVDLHDEDSWRLDRCGDFPNDDDDFTYDGDNYPTAFQTACCFASTTFIEMFLVLHEETADPEQYAYQKRHLSAAYIRAICSGDEDLENMILRTGLVIRDVEKTLGFEYIDRHLRVGLRYAFKLKAYNVAERLLSIGANPNRAEDSDQTCKKYSDRTVLQYAARDNEAGLVRKLLEKGAQVNAKPVAGYGATALQFAAINGNFEICNILLTAGAEINACPAEIEGRTAIEGAAEHGRLDMTHYLLELGADIRGRTSRNYRRTVYRAWKNGHYTLVRMLQDWKMQNYGSEDCEDVQTILDTITGDEL